MYPVKAPRHRGWLAAFEAALPIKPPALPGGSDFRIGATVCQQRISVSSLAESVAVVRTQRPLGLDVRQRITYTSGP